MSAKYAQIYFTKIQTISEIIGEIGEYVVRMYYLKDCNDNMGIIMSEE